MAELTVILVVSIVSILNANAIDIIQQEETTIQKNDSYDETSRIQPHIKNSTKITIFNVSNADEPANIIKEAVNDNNTGSKVVHESVKVTLRKHSKNGQSNDDRANGTHYDFVSWSNLDNSKLKNSISNNSKVTRQDLEEKADSTIKHKILISKTNEIHETTGDGKDSKIIYIPYYSGVSNNIRLPEYDNKRISVSKTSEISQMNVVNNDINANTNEINESGLHVYVNKHGLDESNHNITKVNSSVSKDHGTRISISETTKVKDGIDDAIKERESFKDTPKVNIVNLISDITNNNDARSKSLDVDQKGKGVNNTDYNSTINVKEKLSLENNTKSDYSKANNNNTESFEPNGKAMGTSENCDKKDFQKCLLASRYRTGLDNIVCNKISKNIESFWLLLDQYVYKDQGQSMDLSKLEKLFTLLSIFVKLNEARESGTQIDLMIDHIIQILENPQLNGNTETQQYISVIKPNKFKDVTNVYLMNQKISNEDDKHKVKIGSLRQNVNNYESTDDTKHIGAMLTSERFSTTVPVVIKNNERVDAMLTSNIDINEHVKKGEKSLTKDIDINNITTENSAAVKDELQSVSNNFILKLKHESSTNDSKMVDDDILFNLYKKEALANSNKAVLMNNYEVQTFNDKNVMKNPTLNRIKDGVNDNVDKYFELAKDSKYRETLIINNPDDVTSSIPNETTTISIHAQSNELNNLIQNIESQENIFPDNTVNNFLTTPNIYLQKQDNTKLTFPKNHNIVVSSINKPEQNIMSITSENEQIVATENPFIFNGVEEINSKQPRQTNSDAFLGTDNDFLGYLHLYQKLQNQAEPEVLTPKISMTQSNPDISALSKILKEKISEIFMPLMTESAILENQKIKNSHPSQSNLTDFGQNKNDHYLSNILRALLSNDKKITRSEPITGLKTEGDIETNNGFLQINRPDLIDSIKTNTYEGNINENNLNNYLMLQNHPIDRSKYLQLLFNVNKNNLQNKNNGVRENSNEPFSNVDATADLLIKVLDRPQEKKYNNVDGNKNTFDYDLALNNQFEINNFFSNVDRETMLGSTKQNPFNNMDNENSFDHMPSHRMSLPELISFLKQQQGVNFEMFKNINIDDILSVKQDYEKFIGYGNEDNLNQSTKQLVNIFENIKSYLQEKGVNDGIINTITSKINEGFPEIQNMKCPFPQYKDLLEKIREAVDSSLYKG